MPRVEQVPEHADGGFWYVVPVRDTEDIPGREPDLPDGAAGWCAWYGTVAGADLCAVRSPDPIDGVDAHSVPVEDVLAAAYAAGSTPDPVKPHGRIGDR